MYRYIHLNITAQPFNNKDVIKWPYLVVHPRTESSCFLSCDKTAKAIADYFTSIQKSKMNKKKETRKHCSIQWTIPESCITLGVENKRNMNNFQWLCPRVGPCHQKRFNIKAKDAQLHYQNCSSHCKFLSFWTPTASAYSVLTGLGHSPSHSSHPFVFPGCSFWNCTSGWFLLIIHNLK